MILLKEIPLKDMQDLVNREKVYMKMEETLDDQLKNIDGKTILSDIKKFCKTITKTLNIKLTSNALIGITLHMACMVDRLCGNGEINEYVNKESIYKRKLRIIQNNKE